MPPAPLFATPFRPRIPGPDLVSAPVKVTAPPNQIPPALTVTVRATATVVAPFMVMPTVPWAVTLPPSVKAFVGETQPVVVLSSVPPFQLKAPVPMEVAFIRFNVPAVSVVPPEKAWPP